MVGLLKKITGIRYSLLCMVFLTAMCMAVLTGCSGGKDSGEKVRDLDFTVVGNNEVPEELQKIIEQKKQDMFRLTYSNDQALYIVVGYGQQKTGGYSISVPQLYLTNNSVIIKTELTGPEKSENVGNDPSFPYIVVKTEFLEEPVVFQ